jgi:hypothetical protein
MLNHLVLPQEPILPASIAGWMLTLDHFSSGPSMNSDDMSLKVSFPFKSLALALTGLPKAVV